MKLLGDNRKLVGLAAGCASCSGLFHSGRCLLLVFSSNLGLLLRSTLGCLLQLVLLRWFFGGSLLLCLLFLRRCGCCFCSFARCSVGFYFLFRLCFLFGIRAVFRFVLLLGVLFGLLKTKTQVSKPTFYVLLHPNLICRFVVNPTYYVMAGLKLPTRDACPS